MITVDEGLRRRCPDLGQGSHVRVTLSDTGCSMPHDVSDRVLEPVLVTKPPGKSIDLGLSVAYGIIRQHQGWIDVQTEEVRGSTSIIYLPLCNRPATGSAEQGSVSTAGGGETVLFVEDEGSVRRMATRVRRQAGYRALEASDGPDAIELAVSYRGSIDLAVIDMVMPGGLTGMDTRNSLLAIRPGMAVMLSSGYASPLVELGVMPNDHVPFLPKPYEGEALLRNVRRVLDRRRRT